MTRPSKEWFEFEKFTEGELLSLEYQPSRLLLTRVKRALRERDRIFALMFKAADTDQTLLDSKDSVLDLMPECPTHGKHCSSFQKDWVETMVKIEEMLSITRVQSRLDLSEDHAWQPISPNTLPEVDLEKAINTGRNE